MSIEFSFDANRHLYLVQGRPVPSVTQVLHSAGLEANYSMVPPEVLERKRIIGQFVHEATQYLDEGSLDLASVDPELQPYISAYQRFLRESGFQTQLIEHRVVGSIGGMLCGGTVDRVGSMNGQLWIIDLKCVDRLYPGFALQTAGYELLLPKPLVPPFKYTRAVLQLRPDGSYKLSPPYEDPSDLDVFRAALITTIWKMNRGMTIENGVWSELEEVA
jgi:hypothetical protein